MTPKFTTPCFVKVTDAEERKYLLREIRNMCIKNNEVYCLISGYKEEDPFVIAQKTGMYGLSSGKAIEPLKNHGFIDCCENIPLFLALAGMREDTDKDQWFIVTTTAVLFKKLKGVVETFDNKKCQKAGSLFKVISPKDIKCTFIGGSQGIFRHATTEELINHFKSEEK